MLNTDRSTSRFNAPTENLLIEATEEFKVL